MGSIPVHVPFLNRHEARKTIIRFPICRSLALANRIVFARRRRGSHRSEVQNNIICGIDAGNVHRCSMHSTVAEACVLHASWAQLLIDRSTAVHNTTITRARPCPRGTPNSDEFFYPRASSGSHLIASFAQHGWLARVICNYITLLYSSLVGNRLAWAVPAATSRRSRWRGVISNGIFSVQFSGWSEYPVGWHPCHHSQHVQFSALLTLRVLALPLSFSLWWNEL